MAKDKRYLNVRDGILSGRIRTIKDIFESKAITKARVYQDLGINNARFNEFVEDVTLFRLDDLFKLSVLVEVEPIKVFELAANQWLDKNQIFKGNIKKHWTSK